jgi:hypothetical protein
MTNKNKTKRKVASQPKQKKQPPTPFSDAGAIVGSKLGTMFNAPYLKGVGKWLGSGIGQIFGSGDYQVVGAIPSYNVMMNNQIPKFSTSKQTNVICHREYLGDILGTAGFNNTAYPLNPGMSQTFPWLSTIAQNYQQYKFHGVIFEFRPLITDFVTNGAPGVVVMATNYNADAVPYTTKQEMENSEYAVSVKPTRELIHGIECDVTQTTIPQLYVRNGVPPTGQDLRLYDLGNFQFATQVNPVQNLGELWVSYCVEFFKPILPNDVGGNVLSGFVTRTGVTNASPLGTALTQGTPFGDLSISVTNTVVTFFANPGNCYQLTFYWAGSVAAVAGFPAVTFSGLTQSSNLFAGFGPAGQYTAPTTAVSITAMTLTYLVRCTNLVPGNVTATLGGGGTLPAGTSNCTVLVSGVSSEMLI